MKSDIHPTYRPVVFQDTSSDFHFLTKSTIETTETIEWEDGSTYPLAKVDISSESHPFYTGKQILVDTTGRVERFRRRYGQSSAKAKPEASVAEASVVEASVAEASVAEESQAKAAPVTSVDSAEPIESVESVESVTELEAVDAEA